MSPASSPGGSPSKEAASGAPPAGQSAFSSNVQSASASVMADMWCANACGASSASSSSEAPPPAASGKAQFSANVQGAAASMMADMWCANACGAASAAAPKPESREL